MGGDEDLLKWIEWLKTMPNSVRRGLKRILPLGKKDRDRVSDALELEVFPDAPWFKADSEGNLPKEWKDD